MEFLKANLASILFTLLKSGSSITQSQHEHILAMAPIQHQWAQTWKTGRSPFPPISAPQPSIHRPSGGLECFHRGQLCAKYTGHFLYLSGNDREKASDFKASPQFPDFDPPIILPMEKKPTYTAATSRGSRTSKKGCEMENRYAIYSYYSFIWYIDYLQLNYIPSKDIKAIYSGSI